MSPAPSHAWGCAGEHPAWLVSTATPPRPPQPRAELTESDSSLLLASPTMRMAASTSRCPGRQFTQRFSACDTALATCRGRERRLSLGHPHHPASIPLPPPGTQSHLHQALLAVGVSRLGHRLPGLLDEVVGLIHHIAGALQHGTLRLRVRRVGRHAAGGLAERAQRLGHLPGSDACQGGERSVSKSTAPPRGTAGA